MRYCSRCLYPETKPDLWFDERGVCSACQSFEERDKIDWVQREKDFRTVLDKVVSRTGDTYDAVVGVSGGKDSTFQILKLLEYGLNPLAVTAGTCSLTPIGRRNLDNIRKLGVDHIEVNVKPDIRHRINKIALTEVGDISWPEHVLIFTVPVRVAVQYKVPLIVWGENSQNEYGGPEDAARNNTLSRRWLEEFGGLLSLRVSDLMDETGIAKRDMIQYRYPEDEAIKAAGVTGIFLGHYFPWDGLTNMLTAQAYGFETHPKTIEGSLANYENLDNAYHGIHDYFKYIKYGFGRATDIANNHIRRGRLSRTRSIELMRRHDGKFPLTYLDIPIEESLREIDMNLDTFINICDRFTNKSLFQCDNNGKPIKDPSGNLIPKFEIGSLE